MKKTTLKTTTILSLLMSTALVATATVALAQTAPAATAAGSGNFLTDNPQIFMLLAIGAIFYFLLIRPQSQKAKRHREMLKTLKRGDRVLTAGGIIGTVYKADEGVEIQVEIADNVRVTMNRGTISDILSRAGDKAVAKAGLTQAANENATKAKPTLMQRLGLAKPADSSKAAKPANETKGKAKTKSK